MPVIANQLAHILNSRTQLLVGTRSYVLNHFVYVLQYYTVEYSLCELYEDRWLSDSLEQLAK